MLGPLAILAPLLAVLSDREEVSLEEVFERARAFGNWNILLEHAIGISLLDVRDIDMAERAAERIGDLLTELTDWYLGAVDLDDSFARIQIFFAIHRAAVAFEESLHERDLYPGPFADSYFKWTRATTPQEPMYSPFFGTRLIEVGDRYNDAELGGLIKAGIDDPNTVFITERELWPNDLDVLMAWDKTRMIVGKVDDSTLSEFQMIPIPQQTPRKVLEATLWRFDKLALGKFSYEMQIAKAMAKAYFNDAWETFKIDERERTGRPLRRTQPNRCIESWVFAKKLYERLEFLNPQESLADNFSRYNGVEPEDFGRTLAFEAMGHGVAWTDNNDDCDLTVPNVENTLLYDYYYFFEPLESR